MTKLAELLTAVAPPTQFLDFIEAQANAKPKPGEKPKKISKEAVDFCTIWRKINAGEPVPVIDEFETTEENLSPEKAGKYITDAEDIAQKTLKSSAELAKAIAAEKNASAALRDAEEELKDGEAAAIIEDADGDLTDDSGKPLPKSSDAYKQAQRILLKKAHEGSLLELVKERDKYKKTAREAEIKVRQYETQFKGLCYVAELTGNILSALSSPM